MHQLPGRDLWSSKNASATGWLLVLMLLSGMAFVAVRYAPLLFSAETAKVDSPKPNYSDADFEDLLRHLDSALAAQTDALAEAVRTQTWIDRTLPMFVDDPVAERRLELARSSASSAERELKQANEDLRLLKDLVEERKHTTQ